jgi:hypothetical protein
MECPDGDPKTLQQVSKKWDNLMKDARAETAKYQAALKGTGNGFYSAVTSILCVNDN